MTRQSTPRSTYRLQIRKGFDLEAAASLTDYLDELGVDWVYLSPVLTAEPGSDHGYDVVDHSTIDPDRGGAEGLKSLSDAAHARGLGVLIDIVPNHMGVATPAANSWWWDLLTHGRQSRFAEAFDVDWDAGSGKVLIPTLGSSDPSELDALEIVGDELHYYDNVYPIAPGTRGDGADTAAAVHARQNYELVFWKRADSDLNYRRFFAVNTLAGIRVEVPWVFDESHTEITRWFDEKLADGLRVDHPDGLADPAGYLDRLAELTGGKHVLVEKILEGPEELPHDWATTGTTGYDALAEFDRVLVDPDAEHMLTDLDLALQGDDEAVLDRSTTGGELDWHDLILTTKRGIATGILGSEVNRLARLLTPKGTAPDADVVDALTELLAVFPIYRSYLPQHADALEYSAEAVAEERPELATVLETVVAVLGDPAHPAAVRFQQTSGMVMAKGVEDTAFYRYSRLVSLNEVGADPDEFSIEPDDFHARQQHRLATLPFSMTTLSTHDTKRSGDVRARIHVLSELPDEWASTLERLRSLAPLGDGPFENLLWQTIIGAWPASRERLHAYAEKASREADHSTTWTEPNEAFETAMHALVDACFDDDAVSAELSRIVDVVRAPGRSNSLTMTLLQLTGPGAPDVYQGGELWDHSLVDPDNRREVDFDLRRRLLAEVKAGAVPPIDETGAAKLVVTHRSLSARRDHPEWFTRYAPLLVTGEADEFALVVDHGGAVSVATRLPLGLAARGGWGETTVRLTGTPKVDLFTGTPHPGGRVRLADLLATYPVALLVPDTSATPLEV